MIPSCILGELFVECKYDYTLFLFAQCKLEWYGRYFCMPYAGWFTVLIVLVLCCLGQCNPHAKRAGAARCATAAKQVPCATRWLLSSSRAGLFTGFGCGGIDWLGLGRRLLAQKNRQAYERKNRNKLALPVLKRLEPEPRRVHVAPR